MGRTKYICSIKYSGLFILGRSREESMKHIITESYENYLNITRHLYPEIPKWDWINNYRKDPKMFVANKEGFFVVRDIKYDENDISTLHYLAFLDDISVRCLRDLNGDHLNLLERIEDFKHDISQRHIKDGIY